jgi:phage tail sheath protein FI
VRVRSTAVAGWELRAAADYDPAPLLELHLALLRMCAARGDLLCLLSLPEHFREREAIAHVAKLDARSPSRDAAREPDPLLSYGALYHPWLHAAAPERPTALRRQPPDGSAAGVLAARAAERGAWIAPANVALRDVRALTPTIGEHAHQALRDARVNLVRHEPAGFLCLAADTLSPYPDVRPIGVRRLLQTVLRLALRHGGTLTFEPNDEPSRRAVRRSFEELLGRMFELGAFAGTRASEGFQVATPVAAGDVDGGRLVVELRVAPARPLEFLTVRLVRTGTGAVSAEAQAA